MKLPGRGDLAGGNDALSKTSHLTHFLMAQQSPAKHRPHHLIPSEIFISGFGMGWVIMSELFHSTENTRRNVGEGFNLKLAVEKREVSGVATHLDEWI